MQQNQAVHCCYSGHKWVRVLGMQFKEHSQSANILKMTWQRCCMVYAGAEQVVPFTYELLLVELPYCFCLNNFRVCC